jgi:hypothetical protein
MAQTVEARRWETDAMSDNPELGLRRSRRAVLAAAAGGAAGVLATRLGTPEPAEAASTALLSETTNTTGATTWISGTGNFEVFRVNAVGAAPALQVENTTGAAVVGASNGATLGILGMSIGGFGIGALTATGTGLFASTEVRLLPLQPGVAIYAHTATKSQTGLLAEGRVVLPDRSGRAMVPAGKALVAVPVAGMKAGNFAIATLAAHRRGRWVTSVVCAAGKITIRINSAVASATPVSWIVLG